jgi:ribonuclease HI
MGAAARSKDGVARVYTDGACSGNPGPGGWGAVLEWNGHRKEIHGGEANTTNNRMELTAAIRALEAFKRRVAIEVHTDSRYLKDGVTLWLPDWKRRGWRTADKKPVKNLDLWQRLDALIEEHRVSWHWVKGHAGHEQNERADALARQGIAELRGAAEREA